MKMAASQPVVHEANIPLSAKDMKMNKSLERSMLKYRF